LTTIKINKCDLKEENLSHKEIAEQMGITPKTIENHGGIVLQKLRESLNSYNGKFLCNGVTVFYRLIFYFFL